MTVLYVDTEHDRVRDHPEAGVAHRVKIDRVRHRLATAAAAPCVTVGYAEIDPGTVDRHGASAIVIGGMTTDWAAFPAPSLAGLLDLIRAAPAPMLGICAGHQLIGLAHGAPWGPLGPLAADEVDSDPRFAPGQRKERGFLPVTADPGCPLFAGLAPAPAFFQSHYWQLIAVPAGFVARASSPWSPIQVIERGDRPVFGVQFHPERYDAAHPDGAALLHNYFRLARDRHHGPPAPS